MSGKPLPIFETDDAAEDFVMSADLTRYDLGGGTPSRDEFLPATTDVSISMKMPRSLLDALKTEASHEGSHQQSIPLHGRRNARTG